ncbi:ABC transporter substrate-binding protein [Deinococcus roseus]|uniref:ABC transporter substrate-binding protein n=1 Tax=Deinococcus roseus TaxID=392414 RepID=A0ABQ2D3G4_9DEIO|nr:ABC transporter substrate-binding protein [Deinococcus roseus]GGJ40130.1 ABC transporter substrate-binding protein [Deinococcus roseus]
MKKLLLTTLLIIGTAAAQKADTVRIGIFPNVTHAAGLVAINQKLFQKELGSGVKLEVRQFANGSQINEAFAAGALDFAYVGPGPAMNGFMNGLPVQVISGAAKAGAVLVSRGDIKISGVKGLKGKKVAVPTRGSTQDISLRYILREAGLRATDQGGDVTIVPINPADMPAAFAAKQVDAALVQEPWGAVLEQQGAKLVLSERQIWKGGNYTTTVLVGNTRFIKDNPKVTEAILKGHLAGINFIKKSNVLAQKALSNEIYNFTKQRPDQTVLFKALARTRVGWDIPLDTLEEYAQLNKEAGFSRNLPDFDQFLNLDLLQKLVK